MLFVFPMPAQLTLAVQQVDFIFLVDEKLLAGPFNAYILSSPDIGGQSFAFTGISEEEYG